MAMQHSQEFDTKQIPRKVCQIRMMNPHAKCYQWGISLS